MNRVILEGAILCQDNHKKVNMEAIRYKVSPTGKITCYRGKQKLHAFPLEAFEKLTPSARKEFRAMVDPDLVKAAWIIYGRRCLPGDIISISSESKLIKQVLKDSPKLLAPIWGYVQDGDLKPTPLHSVVKRFKKLVQKASYTPKPLYHSTDYAKKMTKWNKSEVNQFWGSNTKDAGLTDAAWRYFTKMTWEALRGQFGRGYPAKHYFGGINAVVAAGAPGLEGPALTTAISFSQIGDIDHGTLKSLIIALRDMYFVSPNVFNRQVDSVLDWLRGFKPLIQPGTRWSTIVEKAVAYALLQAELDKTEMKDIKWESPLEPFVSSDGILIRPLTDGAQLINEGYFMDNCLKRMKHYATEAVLGTSLVFSVAGIAGRATVEFTRQGGDSQWHFTQAEEAGGELNIQNPVLLRAIEHLKEKMKNMGAY